MRVLVLHTVFSRPPDRVLEANNKQTATAPSLTFVIATHGPVLTSLGSSASSH